MEVIKNTIYYNLYTYCFLRAQNMPIGYNLLNQLLLFFLFLIGRYNNLYILYRSEMYTFYYFN